MRTESLWTFIESRRHEYVDVFYRFNARPLVPSCQARKIIFHEELYLRYDAFSRKKENVEVFVKQLMAKNEELVKKLETANQRKRELVRSTSMVRISKDLKMSNQPRC